MTGYRIADLGRTLHLLDRGHVLCGKPSRRIPSVDVYDDGAGERVWTEQPDRRCGNCVRATRKSVPA